MNSVKVKEFIIKMINGDMTLIEQDWGCLNESEKENVSKQIKEMSSEKKEEIKICIKMINEHIAYEIFEKESLSIKIDGENLSLENIRLKCLENIYFVEKFISSLNSIKNEDINKIFEKLKKIDPIFCKAIKAGYSKKGKESEPLSIKNEDIINYDYSSNKKNYLVFLKEKSELLNEYFKMLKNTTLSLDQIKVLVEIESNNINNYYGF